MERKGGVLMHRYELGRLLGQGTFAKVFHARNLKTGTSVAVKIIDKEKVLKVGMTEQIKREIAIMKLVGHPNVVKLYEVMATKTKIYFIIEYVKGGELFNKVAKGKLREDVARKYFQQLVSAVDYCHSLGVCHRDLKLENLLLDEEGNLKVTDFGLSSVAESRHQDGLLHTTCGTPAYVAPEVISRKGYDGFKADVWSCGVILYVLLAGYLPFRDSNLMEMYRKIGRAEFKFPNWFSPHVRRLLKRMLDPNPNTRISMEKIMQSSWFQKGLEGEKDSTAAVAVDPYVDAEVQGSWFLEGIQVSRDATLTEANANTEITATLDADEDKEGDGETGMECCKLNAFEIISLSSGFDLSGMFEKEEREEMRFTSNRSAGEIVTKLEELGNGLRMKVRKKEGGIVRMEGAREGRKGELMIEAEVYEIAPSFHVVELKKSKGDTLEYKRLMKERVRPELENIVWAWHGESPRNSITCL